MINIKASLNSKNIFKRMKTLAVDIKRSINISLYGIGQENVRHARELMLERKTGRIYKIKGVEHQAAAPGEAPALLTANLFESVDYVVSGSHQVEFGVRVPYGLDQELGTEKMSAHPFIVPTAKAKQKDAYDEFVFNTKKVLEKMR